MGRPNWSWQVGCGNEPNSWRWLRRAISTVPVTRGLCEGPIKEISYCLIDYHLGNFFLFTLRWNWCECDTLVPWTLRLLFQCKNFVAMHSQVQATKAIFNDVCSSATGGSEGSQEFWQGVATVSSCHLGGNIIWSWNSHRQFNCNSCEISLKTSRVKVFFTTCAVYGVIYFPFCLVLGGGAWKKGAVGVFHLLPRVSPSNRRNTE